MTPRRGKQPKKAAGAGQPLPAVPNGDGYPLLSFRYLQQGFGIEELTKDQRSEFLVKWAKRCDFTWAQLQQHRKHDLGFEMLPRRKFHPQPPEPLERDSYMVFRHLGKLPFAGFKAGDTFYVLWIEKKFGELYEH